MTKIFKIRAKFVFGGQVKVQAHNRQEAEAKVEKELAALLGRVEAFSEDIVDWVFDTHGDTVINRTQNTQERKEKPLNGKFEENNQLCMQK